MVWTLPTSYKKLSDVPGTREFNIKHSKIPGRGGGFIHVPGQVGTYSEWMQPGAQERAALAKGQMQAAKEQWRALSMPGMYAAEKQYQAGLPTGAYLAPGTGSAAYGAATRVGGPLTIQSTAKTSGFVPLPSAATLGGGARAPTGLGLSGVSNGISGVGGDIIGTVKQYIPLIVIGGIAILAVKMLIGK